MKQNHTIQCKSLCPTYSFTELMENRLVIFLTGSSCNCMMGFFPIEAKREFSVEKLNDQHRNCLDCSWAPTSLLSLKNVVCGFYLNWSYFHNYFFSTFPWKKLILLPNIMTELWFTNGSGRGIPTTDSMNEVLQSCIAVAYEPPALTHLHIITVLRAEINLSEGSWALHKFAAKAVIANQHNLHLSS